MNLSIGQQLLTTTGETVTIIDLTSDSVVVRYRGKDHLRPLSIIGEKLFIIENSSCNQCMDYRNGNCFGKMSICDDYRHVPTITQAERDAWPEYGDATFYRKHKRKIQLEKNYK